MPINFPNSPSLNQIYTYGNNAWSWDGSKWISATSASFLSPKDGVATVSYSATPTFDLNNGLTQVITLTGNVTSSTIINGQAGQHVTFVIIQDGTGGRTFAWPSNVYGAMVVNPNINGMSIQKLVTYDGTNFYGESLGNDI